MTGRLKIALATAGAAVLALTVFPFLSAPQGPVDPGLPTTWEERHTFLDDDLRDLAVDPLSASRLYLGGERLLYGSEDGGRTWRELRVFDDNRVTISPDMAESVVSAARRLLELPDEEELEARRVTFDEFEERAPAVPVDADVPDLDARDELADELTGVREEVAAAETLVEEARSRRAAWQPDELTIAQVEGLPFEEGADWLDPDIYAELGEWLEERGLPVPSSAMERQAVLLEYLAEHRAEGEALEAELAEAQAALDAAREREDELTVRLAAADEAARMAEIEDEEVEIDVLAPEEVEIEIDEVLEIGGVSALTVDPANPANLYAATLEGLYRSADGGENWSEIYCGPSPLECAFLCLAIDPSNPDNIYAGTLRGLAVSRDGGDTWRRADGDAAEPVILAVAVHPFESDIVLAGTQDEGILRSGDGGSTWRLVSIGSSRAENSVHTLTFSPSEPNQVFAGTEDGMYFSANAGVSWTSLPTAGLPDRLIRDVCVCPVDPDRLFVVSPAAVYGSRDGGRFWRRLTYGAGFRNLKRLALDPMNPGVTWLVAEDRIFVSMETPRYDLSRVETVSFTGSAEFTLDGRTIHSLAIDDVVEEEGMVSIEVNSETLKLDLAIGESALLDLDGSGYDDIEVTLEEIRDGVPVFRIDKLAVPERPRIRLKTADEIADLSDMDDYFLAEPTWAEVQDVAGRWAEVHPEVIEGWRRGASLGALLPRVRLGLTRDYRDWYRERSDIWIREEHEDRYGYELRTWDEQSTTDRFRFWDDGGYTEWVREIDTWRSDESEEQWDGYRLRHFDRHIVEDMPRTGFYTRLRLDWRLSDLLYSRNQLYISSEVRRNLVPHRKSVLEEVTLHYFDRRSLRIDMILNPPADPFTRMEMLIRLQELDARLDAFTGGYFTRTIREREKRYPELQNYTFSGAQTR